MGDTSIEVADVNLFKPGDILKLDRIADADPNGNSFGKDGVGTEWRLDLTYILRVKSNAPSSSGPPLDEYRSVAQYVELASMYLDSKPEFFGDFVWPPVNPFGSTHETRVMDLPAKVRYDREFK